MNITAPPDKRIKRWALLIGSALLAGCVLGKLGAGYIT